LLPLIEIPLRVYIEDTDAAGIVYYVNYLKYMERARTELLRSMGYGKAAFFAEGLMFVVHSMQINYRASAQLDDELIVSAGVKKVSRAAVVFSQCVKCGERVLCEGEVKVACASRDSQKPQAIPDQVYAQLRGLL
jgi:4-hydroxybenzoyl-CoA thioesterase/acyl-CoA thioester hydrolase